MPELELGLESELEADPDLSLKNSELVSVNFSKSDGVVAERASWREGDLGGHPLQFVKYSCQSTKV